MPGAHIFSTGDHVNQARKKLVSAAGICAAALYLLLQPRQSAAAVSEGLRLCLDRIVPALLPYLVLSGLFLSSGGAQALGRRVGGGVQKLFHIGSSGVIALILGLTGGYPVGAKTAAQLCREGIVTRSDAQQLLNFCNNAGPAFLFGVVGAACYRSSAVGAALYAIHALSALFCGIFLRGKRPPMETEPPQKPIPNFSESFFSAVKGAGRTLGMICLLVSLFSVCIDAVRNVLPIGGAANAIVTSFLELSSGCFAVASSPLPWAAKFSLTAASVGWGGVCVHMQTLAEIRGAGLSIRPYLLAKALQAVFSALLALPVSWLLAPVVQTSVPGVALHPFSPLPWTLFSIGMTFLIFLQFTTSNSGENGL